MAKKTTKAITKPKAKPEVEKEDDLFEEEITQTEDEEEDFYPFDDEQQDDDDAADIDEFDDTEVTAKRTASNPCLRDGYCSKCDGDLGDPIGNCNCRCHDLA